MSASIETDKSYNKREKLILKDRSNNKIYNVERRNLLMEYNSKSSDVLLLEVNTIEESLDELDSLFELDRVKSKFDAAPKLDRKPIEMLPIILYDKLDLTVNKSFILSESIVFSDVTNNKSKKNVPIYFGASIGLASGSYDDFQNSQVYSKLLTENLKLRNAFEISLEVPLIKTSCFKLGFRASYLNVTEELNINGDFQMVKDSINPNAFLINGITSHSALQEHTTTLRFDIHQRNQIEAIKLSPTFSFFTKGKINFGMALIPEFFIYQNYSGVLIDSEYEIKTNGILFDERKLSVFNWSSEVFVRKNFSNNFYMQLSLRYSKLSSKGNHLDLNGLKKIQIYSIGTEIKYSF